jgi:hypothetical protein
MYSAGFPLELIIIEILKPEQILTALQLPLLSTQIYQKDHQEAECLQQHFYPNAPQPPAKWRIRNAAGDTQQKRRKNSRGEYCISLKVHHVPVLRSIIITQ